MIIVAVTGKGWTFYLSYPKSKPKIPHSTEVFWKINSWLGMRFEERELNNKTPDKATIERLSDLLKGDP